MSKIKILHILLIIVFVFLLVTTTFAAEFNGNLDCKSAILMEASTGRILYEKNAASDAIFTHLMQRF